MREICLFLPPVTPSGLHSDLGFHCELIPSMCLIQESFCLKAVPDGHPPVPAFVLFEDVGSIGESQYHYFTLVSSPQTPGHSSCPWGLPLPLVYV